ncbi:MAG: flavin reductase family protein [Rhodospirillales bacterium]|jgi:flavin reductase (DIM6/NTAB) family NADH-FMN oxidoreductase RutF|nr:flavin reductase family protein [Rhodospirillales bacterium]MDP7650683.1 flavin reductase family protein [Rhodospirillales bacterium]
MFYEIKNGHGLPHNPFQSCIVPRPIGWISTLSADGIANLAPFSFFNGALSHPPMVVFTSSAPAEGGRPAKDTLVNIEETGEFVTNMSTEALAEEMNLTSTYVGPEVDEFDLAKLDTLPSTLVKPPRVAASPIHMECQYFKTVELPGSPDGGRAALVVGTVLGIHIADEVLTDGIIDIKKIRPIGRLGYMDYTVVDTIFPMPRPKPVDGD